MATYLFIYGHGGGDPGAVGNGTNERDFNRKTLHPYIKKWADISKHTFEFYDITGNKDMYQDTAKGWGMYSINPKTYASVTEIHEDAASSSATGGHNIIFKDFNADKNDLNLAQTIKNIVGWWGSVQNTQGISKRDNLLNLNVAAKRGINYRLMELGFITNKTDMDKIKNKLDEYAKGIVESITGENLSQGGNAVNNPNYYTTGNYFVALKDLQPRNKTWTKDDKTWFIKAGSKFAVRTKIIDKNTGACHAQLAGLEDTYVTMAKSHVKPQ